MTKKEFVANFADASEVTETQPGSQTFYANGEVYLCQTFDENEITWVLLGQTSHQQTFRKIWRLLEINAAIKMVLYKSVHHEKT